MGNPIRISAEIVMEALRDRDLVRSRNLLALTGIAIGTAAVIAMLHLGYNARLHSLKQFTLLGTDLFVARIQQTDSRQIDLRVDAVLDLAAADLGVESAAGVVSTRATLQAGSARIEASAIAASDAIYAIGGARLQTGRLTSDLDGYSAYAVLGAEIASAVGRERGTPVEPGDRLVFGNQVLTVIGILAPTPFSTILTIEYDSSIFVPIGAARRIAPELPISMIAGRFSPGVEDQAGAEAVKQYLESRMRSGRVDVRTARELIDGVEAQMQIYALLLFGIGAVSLLVSGVGIMNVMFMRVLERRQEIGIRQALGARRSHIRLMFLSETLGLSLIGGAVGIGLGHVSGWLFAESSRWAFEPSPLALPLGVGMAAVVGLFFGLYPAERAARLDPVVALRGDA